MSTTNAGQTAVSVLLATFHVRDTLCALDAAGIQEVIRLGALTPVCHAPPDVAGVVNLRGRIVTILDLGLRLGFGKAVTGPGSRVFIVDDSNEHIGLLVDRVDEVVEVESGEWQPIPANLARGQAHLFRGVCRAHGRVIAVLDPGPILSTKVRTGSEPEN